MAAFLGSPIQTPGQSPETSVPPKNTTADALRFWAPSGGAEDLLLPRVTDTFPPGEPGESHQPERQREDKT